MHNKNVECKDCKNSDCIIKAHCEDEGTSEFLARKNTLSCKKGQNVIIEGSLVHGLYFVYSGKMKVLNTGINGREQILRLAKKGEMLGLRGFSTHQYSPVGVVYKHTANTDSQIIRFSKDGEIVGHRGFGTSYVYDISASALSDTILCNSPTNILIDILHKAPPLMFDFMLFYADQLQKSEANAIRFAQMSVREKVINGLLFISHKFGQTDGLINIFLSRKDIADFAGTTTDQVIRVISSLKPEGLLISEGKSLGIPNVSLLEAQLNHLDPFLEG